MWDDIVCEDKYSVECAARFNAECLQNPRQGAKASKGCLKHVQPYKTREEQPVFRMQLGQGDTEQDKRTGDGEYKAINVHSFNLYNKITI